MPTSQYFCRILLLDANQPLSGLKMNYTDARYTDKKQFSFGSGPDADIKIEGVGVDPVHFAVRIEGSKLFIKNFSHGETQLSAYKVPYDKVEPYTPGEAIRIGGMKQVIFVELFRKFVNPISESEAIIREAWDQAKEAESLVEQHKQSLVLLKKQGDEIKLLAENDARNIVATAQKRAESIEESALKAKEDLIKSTLQEKEITIHRVQNEYASKARELHLAAEENVQKLLEQARLKNKQLKQEAELEIEALQLSAKNQAELTVEVAKKKAKEIIEESSIQNQALAEVKVEIEMEIAQVQKDRALAAEKLTTIQSELKNFDEIKKQTQRDHELEKEHLRLVINGLQEQLMEKESESRAMQAKVDDLTVHFNQMTKQLEQAVASAGEELQRCQNEAAAAQLAKEGFEAESVNIVSYIQEITAKMQQLDAEHTATMSRISKLQAEEIQERDKIRGNLHKEYEARKEFEMRWLAEQRRCEQENTQREKLVQEKMEQEQLQKQSQDIVAKILPLLSLELKPYLAPEKAAVVEPEMEKLIGPIVERSVTEEYEYRRKYWVEIQPGNVDRLVKDYKSGLKKQYRLVTLSVILFAMAVLISWSKLSGLQVAYLTFMSPDSGAQTQRVPASQEPQNERTR
jgi:hypothetical protein